MVTVKDLRERFNRMFENLQRRQSAPQQEQTDAALSELRGLVGDIILYLEEQPTPHEHWNERLGPKPEDLKPDPEAVNRIVEAAKECFDRPFDEKVTQGDIA